MVRSLAWVGGVVAALGLCAAGCGDNLDASDGGGAAADDGADGDGGDDGGADGGAGAACPPAALPGPLAEAEWDPRFTIAGVSGHDGFTPKVFDLALDRDGDVLAAGYFQWLGAEHVEPLLRHRDGAWGPARGDWQLPVPPAGFAAVASGPDGELALATYDALGARGSQIWVDRGRGLEEIGRAQGLVRALAWYGGELWAGGNDELIGASAGLAVWNGTAWSPPPGGAPDGPVYELVQLGDSLFVGGQFGAIGGIAARRVAEWSGAAWTAYDLPFFGAGVYALERGPDGTLYAGGAFSDSIAPGGSGGAARWTGREWQILGGGVANPNFGGVVTDLAMHKGELYVTGCFTHVDGSPEDPGAIAARSMARWTGSEWQSLDDGSSGEATPWFEFAACGDEGPDAIWDVPSQRLVSDGELLYAAGSLPGAAGIASQGLIAFDGERWIAQGAADLGLAGAVSDLAVAGPDCSLYAFGGVSHAGGDPTPGGLARTGGDRWSAIGAPLPPGMYCVGAAVSPAGDVYVGCFDQSSEVLASHVYRLAGGAWQPVGEPHGLEGISDLALDGAGRLWVVGTGATGYLARLDGDAFTVVEDGFDGVVSRIAFGPGGDPERPELVVGGSFTHIGSGEFNRVALWDGDGWSALGEGVSSSVMALELGARAIYVATSEEGTPDRRILAAWDGREWTELATPERGLPAPMGETVHTFTALREIGDQLLAVGYVWPESGGRNAFLYDGERFTSIGGGVAAISVDAVAVAPDGIWFGGSIAEVGSGDGVMPSVGIAHLVWPDR